MDIEYKKLLPLNVKDATVVIGFPTSGLVGSIAASYLTSKLGMKMVGFYSSDKLPPITAIHDYKPMPPIRVYAAPKRNLVVVLSEIIVPVSISNEMAEHIAKLAEDVKAPMVVALGGMGMHEEPDAVYAVCTDERLLNELTKRKLVKKVKEGATTGVVGMLLFPKLLKMPALALLGESDTERADPEAAVRVLKILSKLLDIKVDTRELEKEARILSAGAKESVIKSKILKKKLGSMYG